MIKNIKKLSVSIFAALFVFAGSMTVLAAPDTEEIGETVAAELENIDYDDFGYDEPEMDAFSGDIYDAMAENSELRVEAVTMACSFVGGKYKWGGLDPHTGVDCSGFTKYIMKTVADIDLEHSSRSQSRCGTQISREQLRPGDLVFYSSGGSIDHVAIYMGDNKIVHASSAKTGIKISNIDGRKPVKYVSVLG